MTKPNTQSAHMCTSNRARLVPITGCIGFADSEVEDRRFWIVDTRAPSDIPPPNSLQLDDVLLPETSTVSAPRFIPRDNCQLSYLHGGGSICIDRHHSEYEQKNYPERVGKWRVLLERTDEAGRIWSRTALCAMDDHGWLVEVPEC